MAIEDTLRAHRARRPTSPRSSTARESTITRALSRLEGDEIERRRGDLRREVRHRGSNRSASADALSALPPWIRERYAAEHFDDASNEVTD